MKKALIAIFLFLAVFGGLVTAEEQNRKGLSEFESRDLRKLDAESLAMFTNTFKLLTGEELKMGGQTPKPWLVKRFKSGVSAWLVLFVYPGYEIPDVSFVEAHIFDKDRRRLSKQSFPTGYRMFIKEVGVTNAPVLDSDLLVIKTVSAGPFVITDKGKKPTFEQGHFQLQQYALLGTQLTLVRMVDDQERLVCNSYRARIPFKGPEAPRRNADEWIQSLSSTNAIEVLGSLVWLTGLHLPSGETRDPNVNQENPADAKLFEEVRNAPKTKQTIEALSNSRNPWIKEYVSLLTLARND